MSGMIGKALRLARSKQGKDALAKVQNYAKSEQGKERIEALKEKVEDLRGKEHAEPPAPKSPAPEVDTSTTPKPDPNAPGTTGGTSSAGA